MNLMNLVKPTSVYNFVMDNALYYNPNIGFVIKCEVQGPMRLRMCLGVKHILTNGGECKG